MIPSVYLIICVIEKTRFSRYRAFHVLHQEKQATGLLVYNESVNGVILVLFS